MKTSNPTQFQNKLPPAPLPILTAPTASGKSALALQLAREFPLEIVSADAYTVYKGLDIGTAKPTPAERAATPHHLIDIASVTENYDVVQWLRAAEEAIAGILERGNIPLIVGGTGFYLSALMRGLPLTPASDPQRRAALTNELEERGLDALLAEIAAHSPAEAARMERNPHRILRSLEVFRVSGRWPSEFGYSAPRYPFRAFALAPADLEGRIEQRVGEMLAAGWPSEAQWLAAQISPDAQPRPTAWQALGYTQALAVAQQSLSLEAAQAEIALRTRQYAKRQQTWIRNQLGVSGASPAEVAHKLRVFSESFLTRS